jgi:hypothetical protein
MIKSFPSKLCWGGKRLKSQIPAVIVIAGHVDLSLFINSWIMGARDA